MALQRKKIHPARRIAALIRLFWRGYGDLGRLMNFARTVSPFLPNFGRIATHAGRVTAGPGRTSGSESGETRSFRRSTGRASAAGPDGLHQSIFAFDGIKSKALGY
jgi:hypothetical protein